MEHKGTSEFGDHAVIFYDGDCGVCNRFVNFVLERDRDDAFLFAPLQGNLAKELLTPADTTALSSVVVIEADKTYRKSQAVLAVLRKLSGPYPWLARLVVLPAFALDPAYDLFARYRKVWGPKSVSCRLLTPDEAKKFLD